MARRKVMSNARKANRHVIRIVAIMGIIVTLVVSNVLFTMTTGYHWRSGKNVLNYKNGSGVVTQKVKANRGYIFDRNKQIIAQDIEAYDLFAYVDEDRVTGAGEAAHVVNIDKTATALASILECDKEPLVKIMKQARKNGLSQTEFGEYGKTISAAQKEAIEKTGLPGLDFTSTTDRVYPYGTFASQMIGYAQYDYDEDRMIGIMGMENIFDDILAGKDGIVTYKTDSNGNYLPKSKKYTETSINGSDIYLTLDKNVQLALEKALSKTMSSNKADYAWGIVMEAKTGKILAQAGYPTFDLNNRNTITNYLNLPSEFAYECGSVIKPFVYAGAIQDGVYNGKATFESGSVALGLDANGYVCKVGGKSAANWVMTISDALGKYYGTISYDEGLIRSTNTAIVNLLLSRQDVDKNIEHLKTFGFYDKVGIYGMNEVAGTLNTDNPFSKITLAFGQGSTITSYQLIQAASAIFGDGTMVKPYIVDKIVNPNTGETTYSGQTETKSVGISEKTSKQVQKLLRKIVTEEYGTAHHYEMKDITMMAKTGTGEIATPSGYSAYKYTSSILAAAPAKDPEVIIYYAFQSPNYRFYDVSYFQDVVRESLRAIDSYNSSSETTTTTQHKNTASFKEYTMPALVNHTLSYAKKKLSSADTIVTIGDGSSIVSQYPYASDKVISSQKVFLLTDGSTIRMPNMAGWSRKDVLLFAKITGFNIEIKGSGSVSKQNVNPGSSIGTKTKIKVTLE